MQEQLTQEIPRRGKRFDSEAAAEFNESWYAAARRRRLMLEHHELIDGTAGSGNGADPTHR